MNGIATYQHTAISTASRGRLVVLLYDGAIKFLKLAIQEIEAGNWAAKGQYLSRAQDIIFELDGVLDMEGGGEIAKNLRSLYFYMNRRIFQANAQKDPQIIREVIALMDELNQGWKTITG